MSPAAKEGRLGTPLPRVSEILEAVGLGPDLSRVPTEVLAAAQARGTEVHRLIEAEVYGYLDPDEVAPSVAGYLNAWRRFVTEANFQPIKAEFEVTSRSWGYIGHPDVMGWINGRRCIPDCKTGETDGAEYQVSAYVLAHNEEHPTARVEVGAVLQLRDSGTYRFVEIDLQAATQVWLAALVVYQAQKGRRA